MIEDIYKTCLHAPPHLFRSSSIYMITAGTLRKIRFFQATDRKALLQESLLGTFDKNGWKSIGWVILDNHYHLLTEAPDGGAERLGRIVASVHKFTARQWNQDDHMPGRRVWWNYWDTCIDSEGSFLARLNYVHENPVKHGLCTHPEDYPFSSYRFYLDRDEAATRAVEVKYPFDRIRIIDDF